MKQLSNTPEAVAVITGLRGDALRNHLGNVFGRATRVPAGGYRNIPAPRCAQTLLQELNR